jgi:ankyrin repeat protein
MDKTSDSTAAPEQPSSSSSSSTSHARALKTITKIEEIIEAISRGTVEDVKQKCAEYCDVNGSTSSRNDDCATDGTAETTKERLEQLRTVRDKKGRGVLHLVAQRRDEEAVKICEYFVNEIEVNAEDRDLDGATAVLIACARANWLVLEFLVLKKRADVMKKANDGRNCWHFLAHWDGEAEHVDKTKDILIKSSSYASNDRDTNNTVLDLMWAEAKRGQTGNPFLFAVNCGSHAVAKAIWTHAVSLKEEKRAHDTLESGVGAAVLATASGCVETLRFVLEDAKVDANQRGEGGMTALHVLASHPKWASMEKEDSEIRKKALDILLVSGADTNAKDKDGMKAIHAAAACRREDIVELLLEKTEKDEDLAKGDDWNSDTVLRRVEELIMKIRREHSSQAEGNPEQDLNDLHDNAQQSISESLGYKVSKRNLNEAETKRAELHKRAGDEAFVAGNYKEASNSYSKSIEIDEYNAKVWANRSACREKLKNFGEARRDAVTARSIDPTYLKAWFREGKAARALNDFEGAAVAFFEGLRLDESNNELKVGFEEAVTSGRKAFMQSGSSN